ncbi:hypothetical protein EYC84_007660 [Monilinia fructicola]|nr:hypothetical protein EYC84_007660 [Monilinia fructicola]
MHASQDTYDWWMRIEQLRIYVALNFRARSPPPPPPHRDLDTSRVPTPHSAANAPSARCFRDREGELGLGICDLMLGVGKAYLLLAGALEEMWIWDLDWRLLLVGLLDPGYGGLDSMSHVPYPMSRIPCHTRIIHQTKGPDSRVVKCRTDACSQSLQGGMTHLLARSRTPLLRPKGEFEGQGARETIVGEVRNGQEAGTINKIRSSSSSSSSSSS